MKNEMMTKDSATCISHYNSSRQALIQANGIISASCYNIEALNADSMQVELHSVYDSDTNKLVKLYIMLKSL